MNKRQFGEELAKEHNLSIPEALSLLDAVLSTVVRVLSTGEARTLPGTKVNNIAVTGFGTFEAVHRAERFARNPQTGERVQVPARRVVRFRPGRAFQDMVNGDKPLPEGRSAASKAPKSVARRVKPEVSDAD